MNEALLMSEGLARQVSMSWGAARILFFRVIFSVVERSAETKGSFRAQKGKGARAQSCRVSNERIVLFGTGIVVAALLVVECKHLRNNWKKKKETRFPRRAFAPARP